MMTKRTLRFPGVVVGMILFAVFTTYITATGLNAQVAPPLVQYSTETLERVPSDIPLPPMSSAERQAMREREWAIEEEADAAVNNNPPSPPGRPLVRDAQTMLASDTAMRAALAPDALVVGKSVTNPNLPLPGQTSVVEPSISNQSLNVFYLSNDRADFSSDGGTTFTRMKIPRGPVDAPNFCCDQTIVYDPSHSMWLWSRLYTSSGGSNGVAHISVIKNAPTIACTYKYDPAGTADNIKPDYPQAGLTDNKFYLSTSEIQNGVWIRSRMQRISLDDLANCLPFVNTNIVTWNGASKRVWAPVRGAKGIMYWGSFEDTTQLRIWSWPESSTTGATSVVKVVQPTTFANSDCRGGANNLDWIESKGWGIAEGFLRGAVARGPRLQFYWNGGNDAMHPQAYIRSAVFDLPNLTLLAEPNINNDEFCFGYADVHPNARGDLGLSLAFGGKNGGGGRALGAGVAIEDEFTPGYSLGTVHVTTDGTDMPSSPNPKLHQRYGDYLSVKAHEPCPLWWTAANYAFPGGGNATNLVGRYLEFGRERDKNCWARWNAVTPPILP